MAELRVARSELILGGADSGKTARAESLAAAWLGQSADHRAVYIAAAGREWRDRASDDPRVIHGAEPVELAHALGEHSRADTLIVADCLTLWLTAQLMPQVEAPMTKASARSFATAVAACAGPLVLIGNEIDFGEVPIGRDARVFADSLGEMNQAAAAACERVTLMSAGLPMLLKGQP
jgi:adenosylcobinamide kinase/adenosylcobinamide-phosphate guanylyltransferase